MEKDKIVSIEGQIKSKRQKEQLKQYRGKKEAIQKIIQCSSCRMRCAMCGLPVDHHEPPADSLLPRLGIVFCQGCRMEFEEYLSITGTEKPPKVFWHNNEWVEMWKTWLEYRKAMTAFVKSREFKQILEEPDGEA